MIHSDILNTIKKKKLSDKEKIELIKDAIDKNPEIINQTSTEKKFEYQSIVGLSLLYAPGVFDYIKEKKYNIDFSQTTKTNENLLHVISRSKNIALYFNEILIQRENLINEKDQTGLSPLFHLFSQIEDINPEQLRECDFIYVDSLFNKGAKLDFPLDKKHPFNMALISHNYKIMSYLVDQGLDINMILGNKPLILNINPAFDFRSPFNSDYFESKIKILNFLSDSGYDFKILNEQQFLVEFLKGINFYDNKKLEQIALLLKDKGVVFDINYEGMIDLYDSFTNRHKQVEVLKIFDTLGIDYSRTKDNKNIISYFFTSPYKYEESINAINYLEGKKIKIDFDINQFKDNQLGHKCFIGRIVQNYAKSNADLIKIFNYISENITKEPKPEIELNLFISQVDVNSEEMCNALDKFMQKIEIKTWSEMTQEKSSERYMLSPLQQTYFKNNKPAEHEFLSMLLKNLFTITKDNILLRNETDNSRKTDPEIEQLFVEDLKIRYEDSSLKKYLEYHCERNENYNFFNLMSLNYYYINKSNLTDIFENFLNTTVEKNYLNSSFNKKAEPIFKINRL